MRTSLLFVCLLGATLAPAASLVETKGVYCFAGRLAVTSTSECTAFNQGTAAVAEAENAATEFGLLDVRARAVVDGPDGESGSYASAEFSDFITIVGSGAGAVRMTAVWERRGAPLVGVSGLAIDSAFANPGPDPTGEIVITQPIVLGTPFYIGGLAEVTAGAGACFGCAVLHEVTLRLDIKSLDVFDASGRELQSFRYSTESGYGYNFRNGEHAVGDASPVPEPSSILTTAGAGLVLLCTRRLRRPT